MKNILILLILIITPSIFAETPKLRTDGAIILNIPLAGSLQNPAFSPDAESIIFTRFINGYNQEPAEIYRFDFASEKLTLVVADGSGNINLPGSSWIKNKIVFSSSREPHDEIFSIAEYGINGDEIQITNRLNKLAYEPSLSPDGQWLVFESHLLDVETGGIITKYKIDASSSYIELTDSSEDNRQPNWSPSGNKILYQKFDNEQWNIWIMNTDGTNNFQVTANLGNCTDASFTGDGKAIVFSSDFEAKISNIFKIDINGQNPIRLSNFEGYDGAPSISADGAKLVFESSNGEPDNSEGTKLVLLGQ